MDALLDPLSHGTTVRALAEIVVLGLVSGAIGCWIVLFGLSYSAESLAHSVLPGLVVASLLGAPLLLGGAVGLIVAALLIALASRLPGDGPDTAIAVVVTALFGLGVLLALSPESPPGIQEILFGDILGATGRDIAVAAGLGAVVLAVLALLHARLLAAGFDRGGAGALGVRAGLVETLLLVLVAITVLVGVQGLGNLLVAAILVGPAATARILTRRIGPMIAVSMAIAALAGIAGIYASYYLETAAGASVVACLVLLYLLVLAGDAVAIRVRRKPAAPPVAAESSI